MARGDDGGSKNGAPRSLSETTSPISFQDYLIAVMLVLLVAAIVAGAAPKRLSRLFPAPVLMFLLALIISLIAMAVNREGFVLSVTTESIDADALQTIYLPPLLFADVMHLNVRSFRRSFWQVMWLIFPGVIAGAVIIAVYPWFFMPSGPPYFSAYEALAFGGALSTTDPIAVLMVLNDIGAPKRLAALVGGESLMNDGSSIVIVTLFLMLQSGTSMTGGDIVAFCFQEILAGPCFGFLVGVITLGVMSITERNVTALVTLSFAVPYLTFAVSLYYFHTSGVLAVIALGLVLNRFGHSFLAKEIEAVEGFWDQVEFIATMVLYGQVGLFVASDFLQGSITGTDWGSLVGLFLWVLLARMIIVILSFPVLTRIGYGLSWQEAIVLWHGGLRGTVSVLLSFSIKNSQGVAPRTGALVLFFTAGIVVLFLINIVTTGPLCRLLGIQFDSKNKVYARMRFKIQETTLKTLMCTGMEEEIARCGIAFYVKEMGTANSVQGGSRLGNVMRTMMKQNQEGSLVAKDELTGSQRRLLNQQQSSEQTLKRQGSATTAEGLKKKSSEGRPSSPVGADVDQVTVDEEILATKRQHLCMAFHATFLGLMETELISRKAWFLLVSACERKIDRTPVPSLLRFEDITRPDSYFGIFARLALSASSLSCRRGAALASKAQENRKVLKLMLLDRFTEETRQLEGAFEDALGAVELLAYCAIGLILAHQRGRRTIHEIFAVFQEDDLDDDVEENPKQQDEREEKRPRTTALAQSAELALILEESRKDCERPALYLDLVLKLFPDVVARIKKSHARAQVHEMNIRTLGGMKRDGFVAGVALKQLLREVEQIDDQVAKLEFPVVASTSVGNFGIGLGANPNFGPFVGLRKRRRGSATSSQAVVNAVVNALDSERSPVVEKDSALVTNTDADGPVSSSSQPLLDDSAKMQQTPKEAQSDVAESATSELVQDASSSLMETMEHVPAEQQLETSESPAERTTTVEASASEQAPPIEPVLHHHNDLTAFVTGEQALEQVLDHVDDLLAVNIEKDPELRVTL